MSHVTACGDGAADVVAVLDDDDDDDDDDDVVVDKEVCATHSAETTIVVAFNFN